MLLKKQGVKVSNGPGGVERRFLELEGAFRDIEFLMDLVELKVLFSVGKGCQGENVSNGPGGVESSYTLTSLRFRVPPVSNGPGGVERIRRYIDIQQGGSFSF